MAAAAAWSLVPEQAAAQAGLQTNILPQIVVTAGRSPQTVDQTASAISTVSEADIAAGNPASLADALRAVPGLDITENGGPGGTMNIRLRGANTGQTLVMIDGIRVNDPAQASGEFDFSMLDPGSIERIEVLRGPQSALYGSDAIGGVVNIITKRAGAGHHVHLRAEAGSYGTAATSGGVNGTNGPWTYVFTGTAQRADGFSRYGYRIRQIEARFPNLEKDGYERLGGYGRVGYDAGNGVRFEAGALSTWTRAEYDAATGTFPDTPSEATRKLYQGWARGVLDSFGGNLVHSLQIFANRVDRSFNDVSYKTNTLPQNTTSTITDFIGDRVGAEYQGDLRLGAFGSLIFGGKVEHETAATFSSQLLPTPLPKTQTLAGDQDTRSLFALWQVPIGERLTASLGGRIDDVQGVDRFETWRATAAYRIFETHTKLRASAGTGGKAPTLFQLYAPTFGNPSLQSEQSIGWDAGIDQSLFDGRATVSVTGFGNRFDNLIEFDVTAMRYFNVAKAETSGVEVSADVEVLPQWLRIKAAYTYLNAIDLETHLKLQRRPRHSARIAFAFTPATRWLIEPRWYLVSQRYNNAGERNPLSGYGRLDIYTQYKVDETWQVFARLENATNTRYEEAQNFGTTGRAVYAGVSGTW